MKHFPSSSHLLAIDHLLVILFSGPPMEKFCQGILCEGRQYFKTKLSFGTKEANMGSSTYLQVCDLNSMTQYMTGRIYIICQLYSDGRKLKKHT